jgi:hypothetical protein
VPADPAGARHSRRRAAGIALGTLLLAWAALSGQAEPAPQRRLALVGGRFYGPAQLGDARIEGTPPAPICLRTGVGARLEASVPPFDTAAAPGPLSEGAWPGECASDGRGGDEPFDLGRASVMHGTLRLAHVVLRDEAGEAELDLYLDEDRHWTFSVDLALDPGFDWGVIRVPGLQWSTAPRLLPESLQSAQGQPGGFDGAGSVTSGEAVPGLLGDDDLDGRLDGLFNAVDRFPASSWLVPGAPFAQTRAFVSDIEVTPLEAAGLTLAGALAYLNLTDAGTRPDRLRADATRRLELTAVHLARALHASPGDAATAVALALVRHSAHALAQGGDVPDRRRLRELVPILLGEAP